MTEHPGDRADRAAQLEAVVTAGRLSLAADAHRNTVATGVTSHDDAVTDVVSLEPGDTRRRASGRSADGGERRAVRLTDPVEIGWAIVP